MLKENHYQHNIEPNYWNILLKDLMDEKSVVDYRGQCAMEFGCGAGRNLVNMAILGGFSRVDGIDISKDNARNSMSFFREKISSPDVQCVCLEGDGYSCRPLPSNQYKFVMSDQVFIHIPNYEVRKSIILDIKRVMVKGGCLSCISST